MIEANSAVDRECWLISHKGAAVRAKQQLIVKKKKKQTDVQHFLISTRSTRLSFPLVPALSGEDLIIWFSRRVVDTIYFSYRCFFQTDWKLAPATPVCDSQCEEEEDGWRETGRRGQEARRGVRAWLTCRDVERISSRSITESWRPGLLEKMTAESPPGKISQ